MKIAFVISSLGSGGAERVASILANEWSRMGHEVTFYCTHDFEKQVYKTDERIVIKKLREKNRSGYFKLVSKLKKEFLKDKMDVAVSFMTTPSFYAYVAAKKAKIPLICSERNNPYMFPQGKFKRAVRQFVFKRAKHIVFQTNDAKEFFSKKIQSKSSVVFNPCDNNLPLRSFPEEKVIISAGRLNYQKDFGTLINGFSLFNKEFSDYKLKIYGDGEEKEKLEELIKTLKLSDSCTIEPFSNDIKTIISKSSIFVSSSIFEGMPNVLLESLAIGTPSIATDCPIGGSKLLMEGNNYGKLFEIGNVEQLSKHLKEIANNYNEYYNGAVHFGASLREKLDSQKIAKQWIDIFERCRKNE